MNLTYTSPHWGKFMEEYKIQEDKSCTMRKGKNTRIISCNPKKNLGKYKI